MTTTRRLLVIVIGLQLMIIAGQWLGTPGYVTPAQAQGAKDPAGDRAAIVDELKNIGGKLDKVTDILSSGDLQVKVIQPDEAKDKTSGR